MADNVSPIFDGEYFEIINVDNDKVTAKCVKCLNKNISGGLKFTSNFKLHIKVSDFQ